MSNPAQNQHYWDSPFVDWRDELPSDWHMLIFYIRVARQKARVPAVVEALRLLSDLSPMPLIGGPLADRRGVFWIGISPDHLSEAVSRLPWLGYTSRVDLTRAADAVFVFAEGLEVVRWRGRSYHLDPVYREDPEHILGESPDKRTFLLPREGSVIAVQGYRGDGRNLSRRGLPVPDARLLSNLVFRPSPVLFLEPFAGVGGVIIEARKRGYQVVSVDVDPFLRHGLHGLGALHCIGEAQHLPFPSSTFSAIGTEPPYHPQSEAFLGEWMVEMHRVLASGGRMSMLVAAWQAESLRELGFQLGLRCFLDSQVNRKGLDVVVLAWEKMNHPDVGPRN